ncbi:hypothetical protein AB0J86_35025 [Micromonospora sp. NPDC049559]|uniref:hypothetical protein n=1 Tax=Micromonospora sp. NPDC049559 TaxID=3155923 RepID=UPI003431F557
MIVGLGGLALLAVCGIGSYFLLADEWQGRSMRAAEVAAEPSVAARDISSRAVDPAPLTIKEVYPEERLVIASGGKAYQLLKTEAVDDCRMAATQQISGLLQRLGCNQVVRGTLRTSDGRYLLTSGIFNLNDATGAGQAREQIKPMVTGGRERFLGMAAGTGTEPVATANTQVGWHVRGHFLVYCVLAQADGQPIASTDADAQRVMFEVIEQYLRGAVLERRATAPR